MDLTADGNVLYADLERAAPLDFSRAKHATLRGNGLYATVLQFIDSEVTSKKFIIPSRLLEVQNMTVQTTTAADYLIGFAIVGYFVRFSGCTFCLENGDDSSYGRIGVDLSANRCINNLIIGNAFNMASSSTVMDGECAIYELTEDNQAVNNIEVSEAKSCYAWVSEPMFTEQTE